MTPAFGMSARMSRLRIICLLPLLGLCSCTYLIGKAAKMGMFDKKLEKARARERRSSSAPSRW